MEENHPKQGAKRGFEDEEDIGDISPTTLYCDMTSRTDETKKTASPSQSKRKRVRDTRANDTPSTASSKKPKGRTNWATGAARVQLEQAVRGWDEQMGRSDRKDNGERLLIKDYAAKVGIPYHTFRKYVANQHDKRRVVGHSTGRQPLIGKEEQAVIAQELAEMGGGLLPNEAVDVVRERHPELSKTQALRHLHQTLLKHHPEHLQVPPKRTYQRRRQRQREKEKVGVEDKDDEEHVDDADTDEDEETEEETHGKNPPLQATRKQQLAAIDARISKLRSDLLDAELEKERLLRLK